MSLPVKQSSFIGGEIDPALHARTDLERYGQALATCRNFIVRPTGGVLNRPGTRFIAETPGSAAVRLVPFVFSQAPGQSYVLEFSPLKVRFYANGGIVLDGAAPYEVATPYTAEQLASIRYAQAGDVLTIVHPEHPPKELRRLGHTSWTLTDLVFDRTLLPPTGVVVTQPGVPAVDATHPERSWFYIVTAIAQLPNGDDGDESLGSDQVGDTLQSYGDRPDIIVSWTPPAGSVAGYNVYKGRSGSFGFIGFSRGASNQFRDNALSPVYNDSPPTGRNPFVGAGNYPSLVAFFEQRLVLANSLNAPTTVWTSRTGALRNFDVSRPAKDDDAITLALASLQVDEIRSLVPMRSLLVLTSSSEWSVGGADNRPAAPTALEARPHSFEGSESLSALVIGNVAMFVPRAGGVRSLFFDWQADGYATKDLSILAGHLFAGRSIVSWSYASKPFKCLWAVLDNGAMVALTYVREHEVWAWHQHDTDGAVEQVCSIPEGDEDALYLAVERDGSRFVERMARRLIADPVDGCFLDSALTYDGRNAEPGRTFKFTGGTTWLSDSEADVVSLGFSFPAYVFTGSDVGAQIVIDGIRALVLSQDDPYRVHVRFLEDVPVETRDASSAGWGIERKTVSGLSHLEGRTVRACADGNAHPEMVVVGGGVTLQHHAAVIHVGLPYVSEMVSLPLRIEATAKKALKGVWLDLLDSRGVEVGAVSSPSLYAQTSRTVEDGWGGAALKTGLEHVLVTSGYDEAGKWTVRQEEPLPAGVLAVIPDVEGNRAA
jgi:hypothetical protein